MSYIAICETHSGIGAGDAQCVIFSSSDVDRGVDHSEMEVSAI